MASSPHSPARGGLLRPWSALLAWAAAALLLGACAANGPPGGPLPAFAEFEGDEVKSVRFEGERGDVPRDSLDAVVATSATSCRPFKFLCLRKTRRTLDLNVLSRDLVRIRILFRDHGYYGSRVVPDVQDAGDDDVRVVFRLDPGDRVILREQAVVGVEGILDTARLRRRLPLKEGEPFRRKDFIASADTIRAQLLQRGHAYAQVLRNYTIDTIADVAVDTFTAVPGPVVTVDSVLIEGTFRLEEKIVRRQLTFGEGDLLRASDLARSQRNLFDLELVGFASVEIAPDSLQLAPDSLELEPDTVGSTVLVRVVEAARFAVETAAGYGTRDCFRAQGSRVDRNFLGGARRLEVAGAVSKVGVGGPLNLEENVCQELRPDPDATELENRIATALNYRLAVDFLQPRLFGTRTSVVAGVNAERTSELGLYIRESFGGQLGAVRRVAPRTVVTATFNVQRGRTQAPDVVFCRGFEVCDSTSIETLSRSRWSNSLTLGAVHNRSRGPAGQPIGGYQVRGGVDFASELLGSDDRYLRGLAEGAIYREVRRGWVLSGRLLAGSFLNGFFAEPDEYLPPERRFYGGGPSNVRGFDRNALGPQVYVVEADTSEALGYDPDEARASATGGTRTVVASAELQLPSPVLRDRLRLAAFVDAGQVWDTRDRDADDPADQARTNLGLRITPGVGVRFATPVGPFRLDLAFNPYSPEEGPLYVYDETGALTLVRGRFRPTADRSFLDRLTVHVAVGNAF